MDLDKPSDEGEGGGDTCKMGCIGLINYKYLKTKMLREISGINWPDFILRGGRGGDTKGLYSI